MKEAPPSAPHLVPDVEQSVDTFVDLIHLWSGGLQLKPRGRVASPQGQRSSPLQSSVPACGAGVTEPGEFWAVVQRDS